MTATYMLLLHLQHICCVNSRHYKTKAEEKAHMGATVVM